jgi:hypothetical protein
MFTIAIYGFKFLINYFHSISMALSSVRDTFLYNYAFKHNYFRELKKFSCLGGV